MHHFIAETSQMDVSSMSAFSRQAETIYEENLGAYVKLVIRRPFGRIIVCTHDDITVTLISYHLPGLF
jgi:hypothetical protein